MQIRKGCGSPLLPLGSAHSLGRCQHLSAERKKLSSRQKQPCARVHGFEGVWARFPHTPHPLRCLHTVCRLHDCLPQPKAWYVFWLGRIRRGLLGSRNQTYREFHFLDFFVKYWNEMSPRKWTSQCVRVFLCEPSWNELRGCVNLFYCELCCYLAAYSAKIAITQKQ